MLGLGILDAFDKSIPWETAAKRASSIPVWHLPVRFKLRRQFLGNVDDFRGKKRRRHVNIKRGAKSIVHLRVRLVESVEVKALKPLGSVFQRIIEPLNQLATRGG